MKTKNTCRNDLISQKSRASLFQPLLGLSSFPCSASVKKNCMTAQVIATKEAGLVMASLLHDQRRLFTENFDL